MPEPSSDPTPPPRDTYRHGDLRRALIEAGVALAREGGPQSVVLREATRRAGVAPNAAYRHFANHQALLEAVRAHALGELAQAIEAQWAKAQRVRGAAARARAQLRAVGMGYLGFARTQTGLFRTAFMHGPHDVQVPTDPARTAAMGLNPFELLGKALDALVDVGALAPKQRPGAEYLAWAAVHGLAALALDGPLRGAGDQEMAALAQRLVEMVERGL